ncbi:MAG: PAS domain-containing protein [Spirochaetales bacterium]|nr:PAS domain-containing protein [Spirochaetales bacterium]
MKLKNVLDDLARVSTNLARISDFATLAKKITDQGHDITGADGTGFYIYNDKDSQMQLFSKRGRLAMPSSIDGGSEIVDFIIECSDACVINSVKNSLLSELIICSEAQSGAAIAIKTEKRTIGILFFNATKENAFNSQMINFIEAFCKLAGGLLDNAQMIRELKDYFDKIQKMEQYQENIFSSMSNLLLTTDRDNRLRYFNPQAKYTFDLEEEEIGRPIDEIFSGCFDENIFNCIKEVKRRRKQMPQIEGIYKKAEKEMDFSLSLSPLKAENNKFDGLTLIFTDQSKEKVLKEQMHVAVEERRLIKDMFSRYMSHDLVHSLMLEPEKIKLGGDKKNATVFFADIRGYTSFSENKDPSYIIDILNEYFSEAVEIVVKHNGYIDKFIGDCIMAAWGVPMQTEQEDAIQAVLCASEIQRLVKSEARSFFKGDASHLTIGIGIHTGPLVAGNLGSSRRMDYSIIGDTVNIAARLEGLAGPGEIIITESTRQFLPKEFKLESRDKVKVKGKADSLSIYNVLI